MNQSKPLPVDYGLPYTEWWSGQYEAIQGVLKLFETYDIVFLIADTGSGKSGIAKAVSESFSTTTILTKTISLEEQYGMLTGIEIGKGRRWWDCWQGNDPKECYETEMCGGPCEYKQHVDRLRQQRVRILNYAQFYALNLANKDKSTVFNSELVVCDEGHGIENTLQSFVDMWFGDGDGSKVPTWGSEYSHLLWDNGKKFLIMSASMIPSLIAETMGIKEDSYGVYESENDFDPDRNPIFVRSVGYITAQRPQVDRLVKYIDSQLDNTNASGVVHTSSDRQTGEILQATKSPQRFVWPKGRDRANEFRRFKNNPGQGLVLISPSAYEGQDFVDDECRWQIITKVPYADLGNAQVRARRNERPDIYRLEALQRIQQAAGRGMRSAGDYCTNTILDGTVLSLYSKYGYMLSKKFQASWKGVM